MNQGTLEQRHLSARQFLASGFGLLVLVVCLAVIFAHRERSNDLAARKTLTHIAQLADLLSEVRQAESGMRGYMLTSTPDTMQTYQQAYEEVPEDLKDIDDAFAGTADASALPELNQLTLEKMNQLDTATKAFESGDKAGTLKIIGASLKKQTMPRLRDVVINLQNEESTRLLQNEAEDERNGWILQIATALAVMGTLGLGWFTILESRNRTRDLLLAEAELLKVNERLEQKVVARTKTLHESETQFRTLAESMPGFVFMTDADGKNTYLNPQFSIYSGISQTDVQAGNWRLALHPEDAINAVAAWRHSVASGEPFAMECRVCRADGMYRWFIGRAEPTRDSNGVISGWIGTGTDIEDRKQTEAAMADANALLEQRVAERSRELDRMFQISTDILTVSNFQGKFLSVSPAWQRITGWPVSDLLNNPIERHLHPDDFAATMETFERLKQGIAATDFENRYKRADGTYCWLSWNAVPLLGEDVIYSIARDVTQERAREEQLRQSQKMEIVGQLTGGIAHDFNNLLTIISGSLELLQRGLGQADAKITRRINAAMDGARRAAALTHRLLAFARRQPLEPVVLEPNRLVTGMADMLSRVLGEQIAYEFVCSAGLWRVQADANQLENCILNLAVNARDAMPDGGRLTIETQNMYLDDGYTSKPSELTPGQYVMIAVTDTGTGMSAEVQAKVFEPFFTTKPQGQGTGLGLAQVYGFIRQSNGHVTIYSEPGQGTSVKLYLPRVQTPVEVTPASGPLAAPPQSRGETILVVEDEENVRNFAVEILEELGYNVLASENADAALPVIRSDQRIDLLFTDVVLTGSMNGRLLANEMLQLRPHTGVLFTTGYTRNAIIHHGRLDEGVNFIGKPFTGHALAQQVRKVLDLSKASSRQIAE